MFINLILKTSKVVGIKYVGKSTKSSLISFLKIVRSLPLKSSWCPELLMWLVLQCIGLGTNMNNIGDTDVSPAVPRIINQTLTS